MIALIHGKLVAKDLDSLEVMTAGGVGYELVIPLGVYETLRASAMTDPAQRRWWSGRVVAAVRVRERVREEDVRELLTANGVGPSLAIGMLSALSATRLIRAIREKTFRHFRAFRVDARRRKRLILDLADKLVDWARARGRGAAPRRGGG